MTEACDSGGQTVKINDGAATSSSIHRWRGGRRPEGWLPSGALMAEGRRSLSVGDGGRGALEAKGGGR
jgi:hypothetical protein